MIGRTKSSRAALALTSRAAAAPGAPRSRPAPARSPGWPALPPGRSPRCAPARGGVEGRASAHGCFNSVWGTGAETAKQACQLAQASTQASTQASASQRKPAQASASQRKPASQLRAGGIRRGAHPVMAARTARATPWLLRPWLSSASSASASLSSPRHRCEGLYCTQEQQRQRHTGRHTRRRSGNQHR